MAIVILSIALPPLLGAFTESSMQTIYPSNAAIASFLATGRMEEIVARRYRSSDGYAALIAANFPPETPVAGFPGLDRSVTVSFVDADLNAVGGEQGYRKVRVSVTWDGGSNEISVERIFADF